MNAKRIAASADCVCSELFRQRQNCCSFEKFQRAGDSWRIDCSTHRTADRNTGRTKIKSWGHLHLS